MIQGFFFAVALFCTGDPVNLSHTMTIESRGNIINFIMPEGRRVKWFCKGKTEFDQEYNSLMDEMGKEQRRNTDGTVREPIRKKEVKAQ